jgi:adenylate cyclase class 2
MKEIECRFLEIDKLALIERLSVSNATDKGEELIEETIVYDAAATWAGQNRFIRIRKSGNTINLTYKEHREHAVDGSYEIELGVDDYEKATLFLESIGFPPYRRQQKKRHTFELDGVTIDIDTWPNVPTYVELEGESESALRVVAKKLGFDWNTAVFHNAGWVLEKKYGIPIRTLKWFTFERME